MVSKQVAEQIVELLMISDTMSLMYRHYNDRGSGILVDALQLILGLGACKFHLWGYATFLSKELD